MIEVPSRRNRDRVGGEIAVKNAPVGVDNKEMDPASGAFDSLDGGQPFEERAAWIHVFTICAYGGGELASCRLTCSEEFADGFELGLKMRIDEDTQYIVREEIGEVDVADRGATLEPWVEAA